MRVQCLLDEAQCAKNMVFVSVDLTCFGFVHMRPDFFVCVQFTRTIIRGKKNSCLLLLQSMQTYALNVRSSNSSHAIVWKTCFFRELKPYVFF